jgi:hypothetical protein
MSRLNVAIVANDMPPTPDWVGRALAERGIDLTERACASAAEVAETGGLADVVWVMGGSRVVTADVLPLLPNWHMAGQTLALIGFGQIARLVAFRDSFWAHSVKTLIALAEDGLPIWVVNLEVPRRCLKT